MLQVDPNTGVSMYESDDIIKYLAGKYGVYSRLALASVSLFPVITLKVPVCCASTPYLFYNFHVCVQAMETFQ